MADNHWLTKGPRQDRLIQAAGVGLIGTLLLIVAGLIHARLAAIRTRRTIEDARVANVLAEIVESSTEAIIGENLDRTIRSWNRGAEKIFGHTAQEVIGLPAEFIEPTDRSGEIARRFAP